MNAVDTKDEISIMLPVKPLKPVSQRYSLGQWIDFPGVWQRANTEQVNKRANKRSYNCSHPEIYRHQTSQSGFHKRVFEQMV